MTNNQLYARRNAIAAQVILWRRRPHMLDEGLHFAQAGTQVRPWTGRVR